MPALFRAATRTVRNGLMDSTYWDRYEPRADDIVIATYPKCGTTWTQRIVDLLVFQSTAPREFLAASPWLDATFFAPIEANLELLAAQKHRRFIKSHLPFDALPVYEGVKYIHVARDGRDSCMSMHNHQLGFVPEIRERIAAMAPEGAPRQTVPEDPRAYFLQWIGEAEGPRRPGADAPFFEFETTYWRERQAPHLLLVHYNDLKADLAGEMRRIADFLAIETPPAKLAELAAAATFDSM
jgi:aryl sulfotransferase